MQRLTVTAVTSFVLKDYIRTYGHEILAENFPEYEKIVAGVEVLEIFRSGRGRIQNLEGAMRQLAEITVAQNTYHKLKRLFEKGEYEGHPDDVNNPDKGLIVDSIKKSDRRVTNHARDESKKKNE